MDKRKIGSLDVSLVGVGGNNFSWHIDEAATKVVVETCLDEGINFFIHREPEKEVLPTCSRVKISFLPFFSLESGLLTGKYRRGKPYPESGRWNHPWFKGALPKAKIDAHLGRLEALAQFAESRGFGLLDLAFSWLLTRPEVALVMAGARTPEQVRANAKAIHWRLTESDLAEVDQILANEQIHALCI